MKQISLHYPSTLTHRHLSLVKPIPQSSRFSIVSFSPFYFSFLSLHWFMVQWVRFRLSVVFSFPRFCFYACIGFCGFRFSVVFSFLISVLSLFRYHILFPYFIFVFSLRWFMRIYIPCVVFTVFTFILCLSRFTWIRIPRLLFYPSRFKVCVDIQICISRNEPEVCIIIYSTVTF